MLHLSCGAAFSLAFQRTLSVQLAALSFASTFASTMLLAQDTGFSRELASLDIEQLMNIQVSSVSRREESVFSAPASAFVITADDIRRSGYTSLPEILRLAPNLQVARVNAYEYSITSRGFNNRVGNKLLVLMDGRTLYTPLFSGMFWEMQGINPGDIDRIEVISGPGGTLWGANAVNGVINIISKNAAETRSTLMTANAGNFERGASVRVGGSMGSDTAWRIYGRAHEWDRTIPTSNARLADEWQRKQLGFRVDWNGEQQTLSLQGDMLRGETPFRGFVGSLGIPAVKVAADSLQARWTRQLGEDSDLSVQTYWMHNERDEFILFSPESNIFDIELQQHTAFDFVGRKHEVVWGGGYRYADDNVGPGVFSMYLPASRELSWQNLFLQDEISLTDNLRLTPGMKFEWNDYTGREQLPSLRLAWNLAPEHFLWAGWSRVVRAPSRFDRDVYYPEKPPFIVAGGANFDSEVAHVLEGGYRGQPTASLNYSVTLYHYDWDQLRSGTPLPLPVFLTNNIEGKTWGIEAWGTWQVSRSWWLRAGANTLGKHLQFEAGTSDTVGINNPTLHNDPDYQLILRSSHDLPHGVQLDVSLRRIAALEVEPVPAYTEMDMRFSWQPVANLELSVAGNNLLHATHAEYNPATNRNLFDRTVLFGIRWQP